MSPNNILGTAIDRLALLLGLANLGSWAYMTIHTGNECQYFFDNPILFLVFILFTTWLLKFIFYKYVSPKGFIQKVHKIVIIGLILALFTSICFVLVVTDNGTNEVIPRPPQPEFHNFKPTHWFQNHILQSMYKHGDHPAKCVSGICQAFADLNLSASDFNKIMRRLPPLEAGCCKPPLYCCLDYKNATFWEPTLPCPFGWKDEVMHKDCRKWRNGHTSTLCYNCGTCNIKIIATAMMVWRHLAILNLCILLLTITLYCNDYYFSKKRNNASLKQ